MVSQHTVHSFDDELRRLASDIARMGGLTEMLFSDAVSSLLTRDVDGAEEIIAHDKEIDELEHQIEESSIQIIARRAPMAVDLREIMAAVRIAADLERIGDLAKNIAKRTTALGSEWPPDQITSQIRSMANLAMKLISDALDAYAGRDSDMALAVRKADSEIDVLYTAVFKGLLQHISGGSVDVASTAHLLFCAKNIERAGDHATNIAENVFFIVTGALPAGERKKLDMSSILDISGSLGRP